MRRISMLTGLSVLAALAISPAAQAHPSPSPQTVNAHVRGAVKALGDFRAAVRSGNDVAARGALKRNRRQTAAAASEAAAVDQETAAANAVGKVGRLQARNMDTYVDLFPEAPAGIQLDLTGLIGVAAEACAGAADTIESIAQYVPAEHRDKLLATAAAVRAACEAGLPELPGSITVPGLTPNVLDLLDSILGDCHTAVQKWTGFVGGILDKVTAMLPIQIPMLGNMLDSLLGVADSACDLLGGIGPVADRPGGTLLGGLLDGILGGGDSGGGLLSSLLGGFGFGEGFGGFTATAARH